ncbi:hypothetical protein FQR65_LT06468 [Abscondita terminalis]|nr:hypothetical protein FQR65_LT06468 [Abscondita terminalis]
MERDCYSWNTSFPAVTICPNSKINENLLEDYLETVTVKNKTELASFLRTLAVANYKSFDKVLSYFEIPSEEFMDILLKLQLNFKPFVSNFVLQDSKYYLEKTITEMGICYCFNSNLAVYNSVEYWKSNSWNILEEKPTLSVHPLDGKVVANVVNMSSRFTIYFHGPFETIDSSSKSLYSPEESLLQIYLTALTTFTSDGAKALAISQRKCQFYYEKTLQHSAVYSYVLCKIECRIALSKRLCGCIPHFYRRLDDEKVCDARGLHCLSQYSDRLVMLKKECPCHLNCDDVNYVIDDYRTRNWFLGSNLEWGLKEHPKMRLRRDVIFRFTDVLVYIGGMAGLFLGCSVLSFIEIFYFFTIRFCWFVAKYYKL